MTLPLIDHQALEWLNRITEMTGLLRNNTKLPGLWERNNLAREERNVVLKSLETRNLRTRFGCKESIKGGLIESLLLPLFKPPEEIWERELLSGGGRETTCQQIRDIRKDVDDPWERGT